MKPADGALLPDVPAVGDLSYSAWARIRSCLLKAAYSYDASTSGLDRGSAYSAIGSARHKLVDLVSDGLSAGLPRPSLEWVRTSFDGLLSHERALLAAQWHPAEVPPIRSWPDVALTRGRLARDLGRIDGAQWPAASSTPLPAVHKTPPANLPNPAPRLPGLGESITELTLRDDERHLLGRLDRLENRSGVAVVVDLKAGIGVSPDELASAHRRQMLFYAGLVEATFGVWPELELIPAVGGRVQVTYTADDVDEVRNAAAADRAALNAATGDGGLLVSTQASIAKCSWCAYQVVCPALADQWSGLVATRATPPGRAVSLAVGEVQEVRRHDSSTDIVVRQPDHRTAPAGDVVVTRLPESLAVAVGTDIAISRVSPAGSDRVLRAEWDSVIWQLPVEGA